MSFKNYLIALFLLFTLVNCKSSVPDVNNKNVSSSNNEKTETLANFAYQTDDRSCMGFPRIWVDTEQGVCVGLVKAIAAKDNILKKPRSILQIPETNDFILTDMGGWKRNQGKVVKLQKNNNSYDIVDLGLDNLSLPHAIAVGPDNKMFIGEDSQIFWFDPLEKQPTKHVIINNLPMANEKNKHPVTLFVFDNDFNLIVNIGAPSDQCLEDKNKICRASATSAGLRFYKRTGKMSWASTSSLYAKGLRNSMAFALHKSSGTLIQAENAMDLDNEFAPFEEINIIEKGKHYGWPYCYDFEKRSPSFSNYTNFSCIAGSQNDEGDYQEPWVLLPPHAAPLGMMYYPEDKHLFPHLKGKLIISFHGYRSSGHRIIYFDVDDKGRPKLSKPDDAFYLADKKNIHYSDISTPYEKVFYNDHLQNIPRTAQQKELIKGWFGFSPYRPLGSPVAMTVANDGAIWFVDDSGYQSRDKGIFIIGTFDGTPRKLIDMIKMETTSSYDLKSFSKEIIENSSDISANFIHLRKNYLSKYCAGCHGSQWNEGNLSNRSQVSNDFYTFVFSSGFTMPGNSAQSHAIRAIKRNIRPMPPLDSLHQAALNNLAPLETFIDKDLAKIRRVAVPVLNVRKEPKGEKCNITIKENTPFYIAKSKHINTTEWGQIIIPSDIKKIFTQKCQQTEFWIAISGKYSKPF